VASKTTQLWRARSALHRLYGLDMREASLAEVCYYAARSMAVPAPTSYVDQWRLVTVFLRDTAKTMKLQKELKKLDAVSKKVWNTEPKAFVRRTREATQ